MNAPVPDWLTPALLALALLALLALLAVGLLLWRRRAASTAHANPANPANPAAAVPQLDKQAFAAAIGALYPRLQARMDRYALPCVLVCGEAGAGQDAVLAAAGMEAVGGAPGSPSGWWRNLDGVAFALPDQAWRDDDGPWRAFLDRIDQHRNRRAFDALVWIVPAALLLADEAALAAAGARLSRKLVDLRVRLGLQVPVYAIVSDCDSVAGFGELAAAVPAALRQQIFGCANPHLPGTAFNRQWASDGVARLCARVRVLAAELGALGAVEDAQRFDRLYLAPDALAAALARLPELLDLAMRRNATLAPVDLRGFYLSATVALEPAAAARAPAPAPDAFDLAPAAPAPARQAVLCAELFAARIFAEFGLAGATPQRLLGQRGVRAWVMWGGTGLALLLAALLPYAAVRTHERAAVLSPALALMKSAIDSHQAHGQDGRPPGLQIDQPDTSDTLKKIDRAAADWSLSTPLLPLSYVWPLDIDARLRAFLSAYYSKALLVDIHAALRERASRIASGAQDNAPGAPAADLAAMPAQFVTLDNFVNATLAFETNRRHFQQLSEADSGDWNDAAALFNYLFGITLQTRSASATRQFDDLMRSASIALPDDGASDARRAEFTAHFVQLHTAWRQHLFDSQALTAASASIAAELRKLSDNSSATTPDPDRLEDLIALLGQPLAARTGWNNGTADLGPAYQHLKDKVSRSRLLDSKVAADLDQAVQDDAAGFYATAQPLTIGHDAVLAFDKNNRLGVNAELTALIAAFNQLRSYPFAQARPAPAAHPGERVLVQWDALKLDEAAAVYKDYQGFAGDSAVRPPPRFAAALQNFARLRAAGQLDAQIAQAAAQAAPGRDPRSANFDQARQRMPALLAAFHALGQGGAADQWQGVMDEQAQLLLQILQGQLAARALYLPDGAAVAAWDGGRRGALPAYGAMGTADLQDYLAAQRDEVRSLDDAAKAPLAWLDTSGAAPSRTAGAAAFWRRLDAELQKYTARDPAATLLQLERLVTEDLNAIDSTNCADKLAQLRHTRQADFFLQQGQQAVGLYLHRCAEVQAASASKAYLSIASHFNTTLFGKFPFSAATDAPPAAPDQVRYMLRLLDAHVDQVGKWLADLPDNSGAAALSFLNDLAAGRALLAAMTQQEHGAPVALDLWPEFRVNRADEHGSDQVIGWALDAGAGAPAAGQPLAWRLGDPLTFSMRWASDSQYLPVPATVPAAGADPDLRAEARLASWRYADPWALLRLTSRHAARTQAGAAPLLRFAVPTQDRAGRLVAATVAFARLGVALHGKPERLALPAFPATRAPALKAAGAALSAAAF